MKKKVVILIILIAALVAAAATVYAYHDAKTNEMREQALKDIKATVSAEDYRAEQQKEINEIIEEYGLKLENTSDEDEMNAIVKQAEQELQTVKTDEQLRAEEIAAMREKAKATISKIADPADYRDAGNEVIKTIVNEQSEKIDKCESQKEIDDAVAETEYRISTVKTDAQITAEEQARARAQAAKKSSSKSSKKSSKKKSHKSDGCVSDDAANYY